MAIQLDDKIKEIIKSPDTRKVLITVDKHGEVHGVFKGSLTVNQDGDLEVLEMLETSQTNKNLTYSLWFDRKVAVNLLAADGTSYEINGIPYRYINAGPEFEVRYKEVRQRNPKSDLAGIWIIPPIEVKEETYAVRLQQEIDQYPIIGHMDRDLAKA